jgi:hypothetical protein
MKRKTGRTSGAFFTQQEEVLRLVERSAFVKSSSPHCPHKQLRESQAATTREEKTHEAPKRTQKP